MLGAHALHPHFHNHNGIHPGYESEHLVSESHHHPAGSISVLAGSDYHTCPICDFLAVCSVLKTGGALWLFPSHPDQRADSNYQLAVIPVRQTGFYIRGPPAELSC